MNEDDEACIYFNRYNHVDITDFCHYFPEEGYFTYFEIYIFTIYSQVEPVIANVIKLILGTEYRSNQSFLACTNVER